MITPLVFPAGEGLLEKNRLIDDFKGAAPSSGLLQNFRTHGDGGDLVATTESEPADFDNVATAQDDIATQDPIRESPAIQGERIGQCRRPPRGELLIRTNTRRDITSAISARMGIMNDNNPSNPEYSVPNYDLYGDPMSSVNFRFAHIEKLKERNKPRNWKISSHRHPYLHQISIVLSGGCRFLLDDTQFEAQGPSVVFMRAGVVHEFQYNPDSKGYIVTCSLDCMDEICRLVPSVYEFQKQLEAEPAHSVIAGTAIRQIDRICGILSVYSDPPENNHTDETILQLAFLWKFLERTVARPENRNMVFADRDRDLFERFTRMLRKSFYTEETEELPVSNARTVEYFSHCLQTTPYKLNRCCKTMEKCSAKELIKSSVAAEATRLLLYSAHSVREISVFLGYSSPSHFIRFFAEQRGMTPDQFRKTHFKSDNSRN